MTEKLIVSFSLCSLDSSLEETMPFWNEILRFSRMM